MDNQLRLNEAEPFPTVRRWRNGYGISARYETAGTLNDLLHLEKGRDLLITTAWRGFDADRESCVPRSREMNDKDFFDVPVKLRAILGGG